MLEGKIAIVTGASDPAGIGYAIARLFLHQGAKVAIVDLDERKAEAAASGLAKTPERGRANAIGLGCDIRDRDRCQSVVEQVAATLGPIDILVNNAGVVQPRKLADIQQEDIDAVIGVNLIGTLIMSQAVVPGMTDGGSVICISSIAAQRGGGFLGGAHYAASKGGIVSLAKGMAREFGPRGVRVNCVMPGIILTNMNAHAYDEATKATLLGTIPLNRFGAPDDIAGACLFLASPLSGFITGSTIDVNGGMHIH